MLHFKWNDCKVLGVQEVLLFIDFAEINFFKIKPFLSRDDSIGF